MNERKKWIDALKGIGIFCVVLGHALNGFIGEGIFENNKYLIANIIEYIIGIFHMPLFFMVSGYLFVEKYSGGY
jgi:fucose 4-O-acetylase-like acetyltransferase